MIRHVGRRLLLAIPTLLAVFTIIFIIVRVAPGDPAVAALGDYASADAVSALRERMGLNEPIWKQYLTFLGDLTRGDLGRSLISQKPVSEQIAFVLPYTLELTVASILIGLVLGIPIGIALLDCLECPRRFVSRGVGTEPVLGGAHVVPAFHPVVAEAPEVACSAEPTVVHSITVPLKPAKRYRFVPKSPDFKYLSL